MKSFNKIHSNFTGRLWQSPTDVFKLVVSEASNYSKILTVYGYRIGGGPLNTLKKRIKYENIDTSHFNKLPQKGLTARKTIDILNSNTPIYTSSKNTLIKEKLLSNHCFNCGIKNIWNNKSLTLQLDHIDGNCKNNKINNLQMLCPNCHSQTITFGRLKPQNLKILEMSNEDFVNVVSKCKSSHEICRYMGLESYSRYVDIRIFLDNVDTSHFSKKSKKIKKIKNKPIESLLKESNTRLNLRHRLIVEKILDYKCTICKNNHYWNNKYISLQLDHIDGNPNNNKLQNLRFLCPNCHTQTDTYGTRNIKGRKINKIKNQCQTCQISIDKGSKYCQRCYGITRRIIERPPRNVLLKDIKTLGYRATGRKYGVTDNSIRKWENCMKIKE